MRIVKLGLVGILWGLLSGSVLGEELALVWSYKDALHPQIVPFIFNFYAKDNLEHSKKVSRIEVVNEATQQPIQILNDLDVPQIERRFSLVDVNFDGIKDISLAKEQKGYHYYFVFDNRTGQFQRNTLLEQLPNVTFDPLKKQVVSMEQNHDQLRKTYYEYDGNRLVLARQEVKTCDANHHCETTAFVREKDTDVVKTDGLAYLNSLSSQKAACLTKVHKKLNSEEHSETLEAQQQLSECYKKIIINVANKFYPDSHFGQDLEEEINRVVERHHRLLHKMAHCPSSKPQGCRFYEQFDVLAGTVDYLNELIEFMVLNVGEGYPEFKPEQWLKKWDAARAS